MTGRRPVRVDERFLELLDQQLPAERGPQGQPSASDFLLVDLPSIAEKFATSFDDLMTPIPDRPDYRSVLSVGSLVPRVLVTGVLGVDGTVSLISVRIDFDADW